MKKLKLLNIKTNFPSQISLPHHCRFLFVAIICSLLFPKVQAQSDNLPKNYVCYRTKKPLQIDGNLNERPWRKAVWTDLFVDIEGDKKPLPLQKTQAKMLWDDTYLYIGAVLQEEHIWAYQDKKDQIVYRENDFEVFIDPDGDSENYYELEINAINNTLDLFMPKTYRKGGHAKIKWDVKELKSAIQIEGTLNNPDDKDKRWTVEIAIPLTSLSDENVAAIIPKDGSLWRINFSRVNWRHDIVDGKYVRRKNPETKKVLPEYNWVWSPQGVINMHVPEHWGYLLFSSAKAGGRKKEFKYPPAPKPADSSI